MDANCLIGLIGADFYTGVPDSLLKPLCDLLTERYGGVSGHHLIAANEGNAAALAAGYHLATGRLPVVYLQNSGLGNLLNPLASLLSNRVYGIPCLFLVGWRGEPGIHDEPQHGFQGEITLGLLEQLEVPYFILTKDTAAEAVAEWLESCRGLFTQGKQAAIVVRKGALTYGGGTICSNGHTLSREQAIRHILRVSGADPVVSTTGKASRELYELRAAMGQGHERDFLTVGSMGHSSSIALGIALQQPERRVWCLDGDGALLMHLGAMALIGASAPANLIHIVLNNEAHESVGGMPTVAGKLDLPAIARACGYPSAAPADSPEQLDRALEEAVSGAGLRFIAVTCAMGSRDNLGRPATTPAENKAAFMAALSTARADASPPKAEECP